MTSVAVSGGDTPRLVTGVAIHTVHFTGEFISVARQAVYGNTGQTVRSGAVRSARGLTGVGGERNVGGTDVHSGRRRRRGRTVVQSSVWYCVMQGGQPTVSGR